MRADSPKYRSASKPFLIYAAASLVPVLALGVLLAASYRAHAERSGLAEARSQAALLSDDIMRPALGNAPIDGPLSPTMRKALSAAFSIAESDDGSGIGTEVDAAEVDQALRGCLDDRSMIDW